MKEKEPLIYDPWTLHSSVVVSLYRFIYHKSLLSCSYSIIFHSYNSFYWWKFNLKKKWLIIKEKNKTRTIKASSISE